MKIGIWIDHMWEALRRSNPDTIITFPRFAYWGRLIAAWLCVPLQIFLTYAVLDYTTGPLLTEILNENGGELPATDNVAAVY